LDRKDGKYIIFHGSKQMQIGVMIKELRLQKQLTQEELADRCELTKGYISQLENDLTSPSITTLTDILLAVGTNLSDFFSSVEEEKLSFSDDDHFQKVTEESVTTWLVPSAQKNMMEPILFELKKGEKASEDLPHEGEEFGYVLSGTISLCVGKRKEIIKTGGSFYFRSGKTHYIENIGSDSAKLIWVSCPPNF
jgi:transcriptional regulator with XRE-family HTH domain